MADLNNLGLRDDVIITGDPDKTPDQPLGFSRLPQPRRYAFRIPENVGSAWERFDYNHPLTGQPIEGVRLNFDAEHPLTITKDPLGEHVGDTIQVKVSDGLYKVNEKGQRRKDGTILVSELMYLTKALGGAYPKEAKNSAKVAAFNALAAGKEFGAEWEWSANCSPTRDVYDETGKKFEGVKGCGKRYYQSELPKKDGVWLERFSCTGEVTNADGTKQPCGASLRAWGNLTRFAVASSPIVRMPGPASASGEESPA